MIENNKKTGNPDLTKGLMHGVQHSADSRLLRTGRDLFQAAAEVSQIENNADKRTEFNFELVLSVIEGFDAVRSLLDSVNMTDLSLSPQELASKAQSIQQIAELSLSFRQFTADVYVFVAELFDSKNTFREVAQRLILRKEDLLNEIAKLTTPNSLQTAISRSKKENEQYKVFLNDVMHSRALCDSVHILLNDLYGVANFSDNLARNLRTQLAVTKEKNADSDDKKVTELKEKANAHVKRIQDSKRSGQERTLQLLSVLEEGYKPKKLILAEVFGSVEFWLDDLGRKTDKNFKIINIRSEIDENDVDYITCAMGYIKIWVENVVSNAKKSFDKRVKEFRDLYGEDEELPEELQGLHVFLECYYEGTGQNRRIVFAITDNGAGITNPAATREMGKISLELTGKVESTYGTAKDESPSGTGTGMSILQKGLSDLTNNTGRLLVESVSDPNFGAKSSVSFSTPERD